MIFTSEIIARAAKPLGLAGSRSDSAGLPDAKARRHILKIALRGLGDVWIPLLNAILAFWVVGVPVAWFLALKVGLSTDGLFISIGTAMGSAFLLNLLRFRSLSSSNIEALIY